MMQQYTPDQYLLKCSNIRALRAPRMVTRKRMVMKAQKSQDDLSLYAEGSIALPANNTSANVLVFTVPSGRDAIITSVRNTWSGNGFQNGSGDLVWQFILGGGFIMNRGNVTFQNTNSSADQPSANSPHNLLKLRLSREMLKRRVTLSGELNYTSRVATLDPAQDAPGYLVANLTLLGRNILVPGLDASLSLYNLFDRHYAQPGSVEHLPVALIPQVGISAGLRISYRF